MTCEICGNTGEKEICRCPGRHHIFPHDFIVCPAGCGQPPVRLTERLAQKIAYLEERIRPLKDELGSLEDLALVVVTYDDGVERYELVPSASVPSPPPPTHGPH